MIAALFALAAAMIIAGVTAVVEGFPYVRLESGMAMVYGGCVVGSSGVLLFGLAVVGTLLKRVEKALRAGGLPGAADVPAPAKSPSPTESDLFHELVAPGAVAMGAGVGLAAERQRIEPSLAPPDPAREPDPVVEPELPLPGLTEPTHPPARDATAEPAPAKADPGTDLFVSATPAVDVPVPPPVTVDGEPTLRSSLDEAPAAGPERIVVGRYSSGGNTYVMFDDGTIEADTPNGRFSFGSLDELKSFVDGGGEAGARGAA